MFWFGALVGAGGSWLGFGNLILIWIWSLVFATPIFPVLALCLDFEGAKNIYVLNVLIWGFGGGCRFLTGVWHLDLDLVMVSGLWYSCLSSIETEKSDSLKLRNSSGQLRISLILSLIVLGWAGAGLGPWAQNRSQAQLGLHFDNIWLPPCWIEKSF